MYVLCGSCYEQGSTGTMAEEGSVYEFERLQTQFQSLLSRYSSDELRADGKPFCSDFCKLVEEYACRWQVPLPQLGILELALRYFARASTFFPPNCDHVLHTLSSLALSVFELLLFFDQTDFHQEPLKNFSITFQECHLVLVRHQNVHLLQVERLVQGDGPWSSLVLQAILSDSNLPPNEVDGCISSELPVFLELRVRYLLSCKRVGEAMALAKCCARHPTAGQHLFFHQVYLKWLYKSSQHDCLHKEVVDLGGKDAVHIICSLECDEKDDLLLALSRAFLSQQLRRGDMYYLCDLVFVWSKLHSRLNTSKQALLEESHQLMRSATNVNSIFPFIRAILKELGEDGKQFCVELCAKALETCLPCDVVTKSLIYKTIAGLLPNDLEVCRACALLVFFLERTVDAYKIVYLLYMHPDQEYHVEHSPIANHVRFEMLQVLKKDLYFDPEFWNLIALRTNCLKLMKNSASEESMAWSKHKVPQKIRSTSICSEQAQDTSEVADMQLKRGKEGPQDIDQETPEEDEDLPETEESKLEYCCTFCNKDFKGCRVVSHAMFHYRRDECMFCGTMFKDDLLAMMHLSDHIEKLKKIKESAGDKVQENRVSETKGISIPLTSAKDKTTNMSSARRGRGRPRKTAEFPESVSLQDVRPSESRKLRSKEKTVDGNVIQEKKQNTSKHQNQDGEMDSSSSSIWVEKGSGSSSEDKKEKESLQFLKAATKHNGEAVKDKDVEPQDRVRCPVGGCVWFKDLSKNRVALLYHALDDHYGEPKPLELAFRVGKSRCAICMRVLWSFEHFQHHVERHRLAPRHPCLHQGCKARFKTGMEMRRHARRHSPLQAVCCLPGCSQLFICLWALNLHEREHYASRPTKPDRIATKAAVEESSADEDGKAKTQNADSTQNGTGDTVPAGTANEATAPSTSVEKLQRVTKEEKSKKPKEKNTKTASSDSGKVKKKCKDGNKKTDKEKQPCKGETSALKKTKKSKSVVQFPDRDTKIVRKSEDDGVPSAKSETDLEERSAGETLAESPQCPISGPGYYLMNGQASVQDVISTVTKDALAMYGKRPYMRIPPTAYLDEKYITMPKRRKEMSLFQSPMHTPPPGPARTAAVLQRQRCANCFATFNSAEDLQCHLQLRKCSNLFGFDSDDEGNS
ncbi:putative microtubule-associated protein futsch-like [Scophthalmus maximus]|uniref:Putative microtubule-associated protein futsch-like n=1 Tax=Scophthalmus maximus TaxID=52904 RepID=A0A2U9AWK9_SCOMX|nr:putative microtubule-associated protein futsch-like [Scophthalmus maximus]